MASLGINENGVDFKALQELEDLHAHLQAAKGMADNDKNWYLGGHGYNELIDCLEKVQDLYISAVSNYARSYIEKERIRKSV